MRNFIRHVSVNCNCGANFRVTKAEYDSGLTKKCKKSCSANKVQKERRAEPREYNSILHQKCSSVNHFKNMEL